MIYCMVPDAKALLEDRLTFITAVAKRVMDGNGFEVGLTNPWYVDEMILPGRSKVVNCPAA
jgi:hypothetical protein